MTHAPTATLRLSNAIRNDQMTEQTHLTVRALADSKRGIVVDEAKFLLVNTTVFESGEPKGIATVSFKGEQIPNGDDLDHLLMIVGDWENHPRFGRQFAVSQWGIADSEDAQKPVIRHKARRLSAAELKQLMSNKQ